MTDVGHDPAIGRRDGIEHATPADVTFEELVRAELPGALRLATVVLGTATGADDVVQVAMARAWTAIGRYDADRPFRPWFLRIVANTARNDRRARRRQAALQLRAEAAGHDRSAEDAALVDDDRRAVLAALNRLGVDDRTILALRYFEHLGDHHIADVLGCPTGTVKSRLARARARLKCHLPTGEEAGHG